MKTSVALEPLLKNACHHYNCDNFDYIFLKLADKLDMDKISDEFKYWLDRNINLRVTPT